MDVSLDFFYVFFFSISTNFYYFLIDVGGVVNGRMKWIGEWRKNTYEKVWIKGVEWVGERHG